MRPRSDAHGCSSSGSIDNDEIKVTANRGPRRRGLYHNGTPCYNDSAHAAQSSVLVYILQTAGPIASTRPRR